MQRPKGTGSVFKPKDSQYYRIAYTTTDGQRHFETTKKLSKVEAQDVLNGKLGDVSRGLHVTSKMGRKTLAHGLAAVLHNQRANDRASVSGTKRHIDKHILRYFPGNRQMSTLTTSELEEYVAHRQGQGAAPATCNQELLIIRRAFKLAVRARELAGMPYIPMLTLNNTRTGFLERQDLDAILLHLPDYLRPPLVFAHTTGWRVQSEVLPLKVEQVDLRVGVVRLEPGTTKNKEGRSFHLTRELRTLMTTQLVSLDRLKEQGIECPYVFHRPNGSRIRNFRNRWVAARNAAGYPHTRVHDCRRSAVRTLERAGVPRSTAMAMVGHKTEAIYRRYAIVDEQMHREAAAKLDAWAEQQRCAPEVP